MGRHQRPLGHIGFTDATGDGGDDAGVSQIDTSRFHHRFPKLDIGFSLLQGGGGIIHILLADRLIREQFANTFSPQPDRRPIAFGLAEGGLGIVQGRLKVSGIYLVKYLTGLDLRTFRKKSFQNNAVNLGAYFRDPIGGRAARQFRGQHDGLRGDLHRGHLRDWRRRGLGFAFATVQKEADERGRPDQTTNP